MTSAGTDRPRAPRLAPTLFERLFLAQILSALALLLVFASVFYVERNRTVAKLTAEHWAPALRLAAGLPPPAGAPAAPSAQAVRVAAAPPADTVRANPWAPRIAVLRDTLRAEGLDVTDVAFTPRRGQPVTWLAVAAPDGSRRWLGIDDDLVESHVLWRTMVTLVLGVAAVALVSWVVARRVARPLEALRRRIESHDGDAAGARWSVADAAVPAVPDATAPAPTRTLAAASTAEVDAIAAAWDALRLRLARHESERALLLAGVSHDLRSPLARVRMAAELLPEAPGIAERRASIVRNVDIADRLIGSFLDYVRAIELPLDATVDLVALARAALETRAEPAGVLALDAPAHLPVAHANALLLERLLGNLLDNALRHGRPPVHIRLQRDLDDAVIDVEDHGLGIPPEARERLTQAFARGDASRATPGTGLGLAVVQQVVRRMGGVLSFDCAGDVQRVRVRLPAGGGAQGIRGQV
jgi:two-component system osmolarity sensor histidine kinase EnvZ